MGIERDLAGLIFSPELTTKQPAVAKPGERGRHQATDMSRTSAQQSADPQSRQPTTAPAQGQGPKKKIICPWWATEGYYCKNAPRGLCPFIHGNSVGAVRQPLICSFWADGDRCRKSAEECSFAHYATEHRQIAPLPKRKN
ncbi:hypothetical protein F4810DRAFT_673782 [Camillea tinctor]|nr:hypothetical protein F4810DRAFT_673782 [Camillea tinctor]